jgi:hypothetical protein
MREHESCPAEQAYRPRPWPSETPFRDTYAEALALALNFLLILCNRCCPVLYFDFNLTTARWADDCKGEWFGRTTE